LETPILLIVFNRLNTTKEVFETIRSVAPKKLYVASDGPRHKKPDEAKEVQKIREWVLASVDWDCEVKTKFEESNIGCKYNPQTAIDWLFENETSGIILEDDCVPYPSFFPFCKQLLERFKEDQNIWGITGCNPISQYMDWPYSYYFSEYVQTWGWATWADRWKRHKEMMQDYEPFLNKPENFGRLKNKVANYEIVERARQSYNDDIDAWDYLWFFSSFTNNGVFAVPTKNLISNIGFGKGATHTFSGNPKALKRGELKFPLKHPTDSTPRLDFDEIFYKKHYRWYSFREKLFSFSYIRHYLRQKNKIVRKKVTSKMER